MTTLNITLQEQITDRSEAVRAHYEAKSTAGKVAPHEGRELELIWLGEKHFATIEQAKDPGAYVDAAGEAGTQTVLGDTVHVMYLTGEEGPEVVVTTQPAAIKRYEWLLENGVAELGIKEYHRAMGRLFGYSDADIEAFIAAEIHCECSKCRGK